MPLSLNTIAAKLTNAIDPSSVTKVAKRLGIVSKLGQDRLHRLGHIRSIPFGNDNCFHALCQWRSGG